MERATAREAELGGPLPHLTELGVDEADLRAYGAGNDARTSNTVLQAAKSHRTSTAQVAMLRERPELSACAQDGALRVPVPCRAAQECWSQCAREAKCEMWVWCGHKAGCDDAGAFNGVYPHHGCQLMQLPKVRDPSGCRWRLAAPPWSLSGCELVCERAQGVDPQMWDRGPVFSSFESGYIHSVPPFHAQLPRGSARALHEA